MTLEDIKGGDKAVQLAGSVIAFRKERTGDKYRFIQCLKEPKGSAMPFNGQVLVCELVEKTIDEENKYIYYKYKDIKDEEVARPFKPKVQSNNKIISVQKKTAPNQKVMPEHEAFIIDSHNRGMKPKEIWKVLTERMNLDISERAVSRHVKKLKEQNLEKDCA